jgi:hypothetical protein
LRLRRAALAASALTLAFACRGLSQEIRCDLSGYSPECGVEVRQRGTKLMLAWALGEGESGRLRLDLFPGEPLIESLGIVPEAPGDARVVLQNIDPVTFLTVGTREAPSGRPPQMSMWNVFFDNPAKRPYQIYSSRLDLRRARVSSEGRHATVALGDLTIGPFLGELLITIYADSRLIHVEPVVTTQEDRRAIIYETGLVGPKSGWRSLAWMDTQGHWQRVAAEEVSAHRPIAVRHRIIIAENEHGALACFPPPHQFQFPRDLTDNLKFVWIGPPVGTNASAGQFGLGIRQTPTGGGAFVPWFNAPPGAPQRLGVFYLLTRGRAEDALRETLRYTRGDRFPALPGHFTFTSHFHMAVAVTAMEQKFQGTPDFVRVFKDMGVNIVHLADFHGDGHQKDPGPLRLPELEALFKQCRWLSEDRFLLIPGEEVNDFLGIKEPGKHPGHWMSLFPKPVYWTMQRGADQPFVESDPRYGSLYRVGSRADMMELLKREKGLAWVAHPRIKASSWTPDIFRHEDFYLADWWLGGAWKAMPADLSRLRLGERGLDLLDDMANWGQRKYVLGEVDVFKIDRTHELFGHMNVNYVRLDRLPRFDDGWQSVLEALRAGQFFVTTGEILLCDFSVGGQPSGETLGLKAGERPELRVTLDWTFPLRFAEIISGDGEKVYRERIPLEDTRPFSHRMLSRRIELRGRKWVRFEAWDVAANGAFTQPVWLQAE